MDEETNKHYDPLANGFGVPGGYFSRSGRSLRNRMEWQEEHAPYAHLQQRITTGFVQPDVDAGARAELSGFPILRILKGRSSAFAVPEKYFEMQADSVKLVLRPQMHRLNAAEQYPFSTPEAYFDQNSRRLVHKLSAPARKKIIPLFPARVKYALAAMLVVALGLWLYHGLTVAGDEKDCGKMACVDRLDLVRSATMENIENDELFELVDPEELERALENKDGSAKPDPLFDSMPAGQIDILDEI